MMVGGHEESVKQLAPILDVLAPPDGWRHFGDAGAGHFVKMIHNGIEYGIMQAYAEGFEVMHKSRFPISLEEVCGLWNRGSVVRSWLLELAEKAFHEEGNDLESLGSSVSDSGEGRWTLADAIDLDVPDPGDRGGAVRALLLAQGRPVHAQGAGRAAQPVRRPRGRACRGGRLLSGTRVNPHRRPERAGR
jgi:6-phosphogluconate dehydrogenase